MRIVLAALFLFMAGCADKSTTVHVELYRPIKCLDVDCELVRECPEQWCRIKVNCCCKDLPADPE